MASAQKSKEGNNAMPNRKPIEKSIGDFIQGLASPKHNKSQCNKNKEESGRAHGAAPRTRRRGDAAK